MKNTFGSKCAHTCAALVLLISLLLTSAGASQAALLGIEQFLPDIITQLITVSYDAGTDAFSAQSMANIQLLDTDSSINPFTLDGENLFSLNAVIDDSANVVSGNLVIDGRIDALGVGGNGDAQRLLTGDLKDFGFNESFNNASEFVFEFLFCVTGGELAEKYNGMGAAFSVILSQGVADFAGFDSDFGSDVVGTSVADTAAVPAPFGLALLFSGVIGLVCVRKSRRGAAYLQALALAAMLLSMPVLAQAQTLGNVPEVPILTFNNDGVLNFTPGDPGAMSIDATALLFLFNATSFPTFVQNGDFLIDIEIDSAGNLVGGVPGDDLIVSGDLDLTFLGFGSYSGTLLTGEIVEYGSADIGATDTFDFRFEVTGGPLAQFYEGKDLAVVLTSESSSFTGDFSVAFGGEAKGNLGSTPRPEEPCEFFEKQVSTDCGETWIDADTYEEAAEAGKKGVEYRFVITNCDEEKDLVIKKIFDKKLGIYKYFCKGIVLEPGEQIIIDKHSKGFYRLGQPWLCEKGCDAVKENKACVYGYLGCDDFYECDTAVVKCARIIMEKQVSVDNGCSWKNADGYKDAPIIGKKGVKYRFFIKNKGAVELKDIVLNDEKLGITDYVVAESLAPGDDIIIDEDDISGLHLYNVECDTYRTVCSWKCGRKYCYKVGYFKNIADVSAVSEGGAEACDKDAAVVRCAGIKKNKDEPKKKYSDKKKKYSWCSWWR